MVADEILTSVSLQLVVPIPIGVSNPVLFPSMLGPLVILEPTHMSFK